MNDFIVYVPPVYESLQHEVTLSSSDNVPLRCSFHSDVSLLMRIDSLKADATTLRILQEHLKPLIDSSNFKSSFEEAFGKLTDDDLITSCPSRYIQTRTEQMSYLSDLAAKDKEEREKLSKSLKDKEEQDRIKKESDAFQSRLKEFFK